MRRGVRLLLAVALAGVCGACDKPAEPAQGAQAEPASAKPLTKEPKTAKQGKLRKTIGADELKKTAKPLKGKESAAKKVAKKEDSKLRVEKLERGADLRKAKLAKDAVTKPVPVPTPVVPKRFSWSTETIGNLQRGQTPAQVEAILGKPEKKEDPWEVPATGDIEATWSYPSQGLTVVFAHETEDPASPGKVNKLYAWEASKLKTSRGVGIGSTFAEVKAAYANANDKDQEGNIVYNKERILVGSIYGGLDFGFKKGKVSSIFIGAGAE